ncbi:hypothetical protein SFC66_03760 [Terribacillus saccharophilus]|uniref:hypothetical protein n=1 Tax=Terribacillus saccharophilus TaxID=361277 RepID=UPI0039823635
MKKTLLGMLLLIVVVLAACGKPNLEGTWKAEDDYGDSITFMFHDDGTATMKDDIEGEMEFEYSLNSDADELTLTYEGEDAKMGFEQKSDDVIKLTNEDDDTITFTKE